MASLVAVLIALAALGLACLGGYWQTVAFCEGVLAFSLTCLVVEAIRGR